MVKRENNVQGDNSFNNLQIMQFLVSSLVQVANHQMTVLGRFGLQQKTNPGVSRLPVILSRVKNSERNISTSTAHILIKEKKLRNAKYLT